MTIKHVKILLLDWYKSHNTFSIIEHFKDLIPVSENANLDTSIVNSALLELVESKIIKSLTVKSKENYLYEVFVLMQPLSDYSQNVEVTAQTAFLLASLFNKFCEYSKLDDRLNPLSLTDKDLSNFCFIVGNLMSNAGIISDAPVAPPPPNAKVS